MRTLKAQNKATSRKSRFLRTILPVHRVEKHEECGVPEAVLVLALIFLTMAFIRSILVH
jgi:hypothetical protein